MSDLSKYKILAVVTALALLTSACGSSAADESVISTAVAQTVQAQNTVETLSVPTFSAPTDTAAPVTPITPLPATVTPAALGTPLSGDPAELCTASATLVDETIPDGTILQPGATFTKTWHLQNSGTCAWDSSWQLVYYGGEIMGGSATYNFPQPAQPGQTVPVPVILKAPTGNGTYTGEWMLKSPWGKTFGVGQYSVPISVSVVVGSGVPENNKTSTAFGVTAVTYEVDRTCAPANTFYTIRAFITTNGPLKVTFSTYQSDGHRENNFRLSFTEASTKSFEWEWSQHKDSSPNPRWAQVIITSPTYQEFPPVTLPSLCYFEP